MRTHTLLLLFLLPCQPPQTGTGPFDDSAVTKLLSLMDSIAGRNGGYENVILQLDSLSRTGRGERIRALQNRNDRDPVLRKMIDDLLTTEPYRIYFSRFSNVTPRDFRFAFNSLPYAAPDLPGGIGEAFLDLIRHRRAFERWYETIRGEIDVHRCIMSAKEWLPPGEYPLGNVYFIYDGNAGSFAEQGNAFFNFCSEVVTKEPMDRRFKQLNETGVEKLEGVIAHELHHVMAEPILFPEKRGYESWEDEWKDRITQTIVSEGVAFRCNPLTGFQKQLWEDRSTIATLMKELNEKLVALGEHRVQEDDLKEWYNGLYHEFAASLLERYLRRTHPESEIKGLVAEKAIFRPDLTHALGWWMVSSISGNGAKKEKVIELLTNPSLLYRLYNASLEKGTEDIAVDERVVATFAPH